MKMKKRLFIFLCVLTTSSIAQTPIPPLNPIMVVTEIGEVAASKDKAQVLVAAIVTSKQIESIVQIKDKSILGNTFAFDPKDIPQLSKLLEDASEKLLAGQTFSGKVGKVSVSVIEIEGKKGVLVRFESEGFTLSSDHIIFDADNSAGLARILSRAKQVSDWLYPKLITLQPKQ